VLLVEDNDIVATVLERVLGARCRFARASGVSQANERIGQDPFDVVLCDFKLLDGDGVTVLRHARERQPRALRLLMSGGG
jgi:DNA-binding NtrC family response regulator